MEAPLAAESISKRQPPMPAKSSSTWSFCLGGHPHTCSTIVAQQSISLFPPSHQPSQSRCKQVWCKTCSWTCALRPHQNLVVRPQVRNTTKRSILLRGILTVTKELLKTTWQMSQKTKWNCSCTNVWMICQTSKHNNAMYSEKTLVCTLRANFKEEHMH